LAQDWRLVAFATGLFPLWVICPRDGGLPLIEGQGRRKAAKDFSGSCQMAAPKQPGDQAGER